MRKPIVAEQEKTEREKNVEPKVPGSKSLVAKLLPWALTGAIVVTLAAAGFALGRLFGTRGQAQTAGAAEPVNPPDAARSKTPGVGADTGESWYYDLEPVVANLNEPGVTRYVRVTLTLEVSSTLDEKEGMLFFEQKRPLMKHWLTLHLANQTIEDTRGEKNLLRLQTRISDALNQGLFPDTKPRIKRVLFKEFAIQ
jgi:flagellar basal body-associated protein FliL